MVLAICLAFAASANATDVSGTISENTTWTLANSPYVVTGTVTVANGAILTIEPGVQVKFNSYIGLYVEGGVRADGTSGSEIIFTSIKDDNYGGDTNNDGSSSMPAAGDWYSIYFFDQSDDASCTMDHCIVNYGGGGSYATIFCDNASPTISNCLVNNSRLSGIDCYNGASPLISFNVLDNNQHSGVYCTNGSNPIINHNNIEGNSSYGVFNNTSSIVIDARYNWWGDPSGPYHPTTNPTGSGDQVSDYVDFSDWLTAPYVPSENPVVILRSPRNNETVTTNEVTFRWSNAGAQYYELYVDDDSNFGSAEISKYQIPALNNYTGTEYTISGNWMASGTQY